MDPNNQMQQNSQPITSPTMNTSVNMAGGEHKKVGPIIATLVIVLILAIAALYFFASRLNQQAMPYDTATTGTDDAAAAQAVQPVTNTADDPQSLQNDLNDSTKGLDAQNL